MNNKGSSLTPTQALDKLDALYEQSPAIMVFLFTHRFVSPGMAAPPIPRKPALMAVLPMRVAIPLRSPVRRFFVPILKNNSRCCIRIMMRISPSNRRSMKSLIPM